MRPATVSISPTSRDDSSRSALPRDLADLNDGLHVRVVRNVRHDLSRVRPERLLKRLHRVEGQMAERDIRGLRSRLPAAEALLGRDALAGWTTFPLHHRQVFAGVVLHVELGAGAVGV